MVSSDDVMKGISSKIRDASQETRIRALYDRTRGAYDKNTATGIKTELDHDFAGLRRKFNLALEKVRKETGV